MRKLVLSVVMVLALASATGFMWHRATLHNTNHHIREHYHEIEDSPNLDKAELKTLHDLTHRQKEAIHAFAEEQDELNRQMREVTHRLRENPNLSKEEQRALKGIHHTLHKQLKLIHEMKEKEHHE